MVDRVLASVYARRFEQAGWRTLVEGAIDDAVRKATQFRPATLVISTDAAPDMKTAIKRIRTLPTLSHAHIVVFAQALSREGIEAATQAGADDVVLSLHTTPSELVSRLHSHS